MTLEYWIEPEVERRNNVLFDELVPSIGYADTLAGEIIRALNCLVYRYFNDGEHYGKTDGREIVTPAGEFLKKNTNKSIQTKINRLKRTPLNNDNGYIQIIRQLTDEVVTFVENNHELKKIENNSNFYD